MTFIKPGGRTWIKTELNDVPMSQESGQQAILDEIKDRIWAELFPHGLPKPGSTVTFVKRHQHWCQDDTCPGKGEGNNHRAWSRHLAGGGRSSTTSSEASGSPCDQA